MHLIVYISEYTGQKDDIESVLKDITTIAKIQNAELEITGVLFYQNGNFIQIIEGEEGNLRKLLDKIECDSRHRNMEYIIDEAVTARGFSDWNMDSFDLDDEKSINRGMLRGVSDAYRKNILVRSDNLVSTYKTIIENDLLDALNRP